MESLLENSDTDSENELAELLEQAELAKNLVPGPGKELWNSKQRLELEAKLRAAIRALRASAK